MHAPAPEPGGARHRACCTGEHSCQQAASKVMGCCPCPQLPMVQAQEAWAATTGARPAAAARRSNACASMHGRRRRSPIAWTNSIAGSQATRMRQCMRRNASMHRCPVHQTGGGSHSPTITACSGAPMACPHMWEGASRRNGGALHACTPASNRSPACCTCTRNTHCSAPAARWLEACWEDTAALPRRGG
jgi:hypothetical protein